MPALSRALQGAMASDRPGRRSLSSVREEAEPLAPALRTAYVCPRGHETVLRLDLEADVPDNWPCSDCGGRSLRVGAIEVPLAANRHDPIRPGAWYTLGHRDQVYSRRTLPELEALLAERLELLRAQRIFG